MEKIKILFLAANPSDSNRLHIEEEIRSVTKNIRLSDKRDDLDLISAWAVRPDDLLQELNEHKPHIVHFSGHGNHTGELVLLDRNGASKPVGEVALKSLFLVLKDNIRVVILNACYSQIQAKAIATVVDCVIGVNAEIGDEAAVIFSSSFYRAIAFGRSVQDAFEQAKVALLFEGVAEEEAPILFCRSGIVASDIILCGGRTSESSDSAPISNTIQTMTNSPGSIQIGRDLNINTERKILLDAASLMVTGLKRNPCPITVGALGMGGEPSRLADDLLKLVQAAGCEANGVFHGVGFPSFNAIRILYSPLNTPAKSVQFITTALESSRIDYVTLSDVNQKPGTVYLFVGYKP